MSAFIKPVLFTIRKGGFSQDEKHRTTIKANAIKVDRNKNEITVVSTVSRREAVLYITSYLPEELFENDILEIDVNAKQILRSRMP